MFHQLASRVEIEKGEREASSDLAISIRDLVVEFRNGRVLRGLDLDLRRGESLGIVGESGSGKSVTWQAVLGLLPNARSILGKATIAGVDLISVPRHQLDRIRGSRIAMIFQDASSALNPVHRVGAQIKESLRLHRGVSGAAADAEMRRLLDQVGIPDGANKARLYPHELSGGQNQRILIAVALAGRPDVLIADEPTTALDATIQAQILVLLKEVQKDLGMSLVLISHDLGVVASACERICVMYAGRIVEDAPAQSLLSFPYHPYTRDLIGAIPPVKGPRGRLRAIAGSPPAPSDVGSGCPYLPRCSEAKRACQSLPPLRAVGHDRSLRCVIGSRIELRSDDVALAR
jgi:peptide/nickel transport system ATP-binding protein